MKILLDNNIHVRLVRELPGHEVAHCRDLGWQGLLNGDLVRAASTRFDILLTVDKSMSHQTSLTDLQLAVVVLDAPSNRIEDLRPFLPEFLRSVQTYAAGTFTVVTRRNEP